MWKSHNDKAALKSNNGLISSESDEVEQPSLYSTVTTPNINKMDVKCHMNCISIDKTHAVILEPSIQKYTEGHNIRLVYKGKQIGFITSIPHSISVKDDNRYFSSLTTYLAVLREHRSKEVVQYLIKQLMVDGYPGGVTTGYFYGPKPKTKAAIPIYSWYRPLNIDKAKAEGYTIILPKQFKEMANDTQMVAARMFYSFKAYIKPRPVVYEDFERVPQRMISLNLDREEFDKLNCKPFVWSIYSDDDGGIITCTMPYKILQPTGDIITVSVLIYCETLLVGKQDEEKTCTYSNDLLKIYLDSMFHSLSKEGYSAVHGTTMGPLNYPPGQFFGPVLGISSGMMFLDFYNLKTAKITSSGDVNVMYL